MHNGDSSISPRWEIFSRAVALILGKARPFAFHTNLFQFFSRQDQPIESDRTPLQLIAPGQLTDILSQEQLPLSDIIK